MKKYETRVCCFGMTLTLRLHIKSNKNLALIRDETPITELKLSLEFARYPSGISTAYMSLLHPAELR